MNLLEFERAVKTVNKDMWVKRLTFTDLDGFQEVFQVWHRDNFGDPYICISHETRKAKRAPDHREIHTLMEGEVIRKKRLQMEMLKEIRRKNEEVKVSKLRQLESDTLALAKESRPIFQKLSDEAGLRSPSRPTSGDADWNNTFVNPGIESAEQN